MMKRYLAATFSLLLAGAGFGTQDREAPGLVLEEHALDIRIRENVAILTHTLRVFNPAPRAAEGTFLLPGPKAAVAFGLGLRHNVASTQRQAKVLPEREARFLYDEVQERGKDGDEVDSLALALRVAASRPSSVPAPRLDPALLEYAGRGRFSLRVYPILPHTRQVVTVCLAAPVPEDDSLLSFQSPIWVSCPEIDTRKTREALTVSVSSRGRIRAVQIEPALKGISAAHRRNHYLAKAGRFPEREEIGVSYSLGTQAARFDLSDRAPNDRTTRLNRAVRSLRLARWAGSSRKPEDVIQAGMQGHFVTRRTSLIVIEEWVAKELRREP